MAEIIAMLLCALVAFTMMIWLPLLVIAIIYLARVLVPLGLLLFLASSIGLTNALLVIIVLVLVFRD